MIFRVVHWYNLLIKYYYIVYIFQTLLAEAVERTLSGPGRVRFSAWGIHYGPDISQTVHFINV